VKTPRLTMSAARCRRGATRSTRTVSAGAAGGAFAAHHRLHRRRRIDGTPQRSKARSASPTRREEPDARGSAPDPEAPPKPAFVIVDHEISPARHATSSVHHGAQVLDRTGVIMEIPSSCAQPRAKLRWTRAVEDVAPRLRESLAGGRRQHGPGAGESDSPISIAARSAIGSRS